MFALAFTGMLIWIPPPLPLPRRNKFLAVPVFESISYPRSTEPEQTSRTLSDVRFSAMTPEPKAPKTEFEFMNLPLFTYQPSQNPAVNASNPIVQTDISETELADGEQKGIVLTVLLLLLLFLFNIRSRYYHDCYYRFLFTCQPCSPTAQINILES